MHPTYLVLKCGGGKQKNNKKNKRDFQMLPEDVADTLTGASQKRSKRRGGI